ncbi:MAG: alpha/beta fold hydrolase [Thermomicrobiales bacterium]
MSKYRSDQSPGPLDRRLSRRAAFGRFAGAGAAAVLTTGALSRPSVATTQEGTPMSEATPSATGALTVVLVHGAFADASGWAGVIGELQAAGVSVVAPANPLRGVASDAAYIASVASQIDGPVLLVGHSYGGVVITNAAPQAPNVVGLVYVAAFAPDEGETIQALAEAATDSLLGPALRPAQYPTGPDSEPGVELSIDQAMFHEVFAADLPAETAAFMAVSQRPGSALGFGEPSGVPGWKTLPSWAVVATADKTIGVTGERLMAQRAGAITVEIDASHVVMISQPKAVADLILTAAGSVG